MPPLAVAFPVIVRQDREDKAIDRGKAPRSLAQKLRTYDDKPLPSKPSEYAPRQALIQNRILHDNGSVTYQLKIGEVYIDDVALEEVLDYVSPLELEKFEHLQFCEEREVLEAVEVANETLRRAKLERQRERTKTKGVVVSEDVDSIEEMTEGGEVAVGKHGRARPTYAHLFKKPNERRRHKRDSDTGELMSLSDDEYGGLSTGNGPIPRTDTVRSAGRLEELPKRRRRKRDKLTGELLPLSPVAQQPTGAEQKLLTKRHRRKRHPRTGELMPIGWSYDPENDSDTYEKRREGVGSHSFRKLSISQGHDAKRQRLDTESSMSRSPSPLPTKAQLAAQHSPYRAQLGQSPKAAQQEKAVVELLSSDEESDAGPIATTPSTLKSRPKTATAITSGKRRAIHSTATSSAPGSSSEVERRTSILQPSASKVKSPQLAQNTRTSILNPSFSRVSSTDPVAHPADNEDAEELEEDLEDDEWFIEAILEHRLSDPETHPTVLGKDPVMLYLVKWEGFDELTWEPVESFGDRSMVAEYRMRVGLGELSDEGIGMENAASAPPTSTDPLVYPSATAPKATIANDNDDNRGDEDTNMSEGEFEIEAITAHHLSDPKTHPRELGRTPVVLYKVKWKGWAQPTWEPASSFEDKSVLQDYHERISRRRH